jgi:hypothetical protein
MNIVHAEHAKKSQRTLRIHPLRTLRVYLCGLCVKPKDYFRKVFNLTDTGRRWDGWKVSLRDKVPQQEQWKQQGLVFHSTQDIIKAAENNQLPNKIMITTHPERWTDRPLPWVTELVWQGVKNFSHDRRE